MQRQMEKILSSLVPGEVLHTSQTGVQYKVKRLESDLSVRYYFLKNAKTLPIQTILAAMAAFDQGQEISAQWYKNYNLNEYESRPCNCSVLKALISRYKFAKTL